VNQTKAKPQSQSFKYKVSSAAMTKTSSPLVTTKSARQPTIFFSDLAWAQLWAIVEYCKEEVGWYGLVETGEHGNYLITELFVPEQEVSGTTTDIEPEAIGKLAAQLEAEGKDSSKLRYWGHSHVDMAVRPSATDEDQIREYLDHVDWFIRGIHNKKRESKLDVYDVANNTIHQCCDGGLQMPVLSAEQKADLKNQIDTNVEKKSYGHYYQTSRKTPPYHRRNPPKSGNDAKQNQNQRAIEEAWADEYGYGGHQGNFSKGEDKDVDNALSKEEKLEEDFIAFMQTDMLFFRACMYPFAYVAEVLEDDEYDISR